MLSSNGFLFSSIIMVLNYYFAQHLKKICTYTKAMSEEKLDHKSILGIGPGLPNTSAFPQMLCTYEFVLKCQLDNFHKSIKPNNYKSNTLNFIKDVHLQS